MAFLSHIRPLHYALPGWPAVLPRLLLERFFVLNLTTITRSALTLNPPSTLPRPGWHKLSSRGAHAAAKGRVRRVHLIERKTSTRSTRRPFFGCLPKDESNGDCVSQRRALADIVALSDAAIACIPRLVFNNTVDSASLTRLVTFQTEWGSAATALAKLSSR